VADSLYERLGGEQGLAAIVEDAIDRHAVNPLLARRFRGKDLPSLKWRGVRWLSPGLRGPDRAQLGSAPAARLAATVSEPEFRSALCDVAAAMQERGAAGEVDHVVALLRRLMADARALARQAGTRHSREATSVDPQTGECPMNADELRAIQAPLKDRYRNDPQAALITLSAQGSLGEGVSCNVATGRALVEAGLHPLTGGSGQAACSGDMLLEALVACAGVTLKAVATALGIELRDARVQAQGDLDFRGTLGLSKDVPVGFRDIRLQFTLDTDASEEQLATLLRLTERYCVVYQTLAQPPALSVSRSRAE